MIHDYIAGMAVLQIFVRIDVADGASVSFCLENSGAKSTPQPGNRRMSPSFPPSPRKLPTHARPPTPMVGAHWPSACKWCALCLAGVFKGRPIFSPSLGFYSYFLLEQPRFEVPRPVPFLQSLAIESDTCAWPPPFSNRATIPSSSCLAETMSDNTVYLITGANRGKHIFSRSR